MKPDNATEQEVTKEVLFILGVNGFYDCATTAALKGPNRRHTEALQEQAMEKVRGWFFVTQLRKRKGMTRADFASTQSQSPGIPDIWVRARNWPKGLWLGLELKSRKKSARATKEQTLLALDGCIFIIRSGAEAIQKINQVCIALRGAGEG